MTNTENPESNRQHIGKATHMYLIMLRYVWSSALIYLNIL